MVRLWPCSYHTHLWFEQLTAEFVIGAIVWSNYLEEPGALWLPSTLHWWRRRLQLIWELCCRTGVQYLPTHIDSVAEHLHWMTLLLKFYTEWLCCRTTHRYWLSYPWSTQTVCSYNITILLLHITITIHSKSHVKTYDYYQFVNCIIVWLLTFEDHWLINRRLTRFLTIFFFLSSLSDCFYQYGKIPWATLGSTRHYRGADSIPSTYGSVPHGQWCDGRWKKSTQDQDCHWIGGPTKTQFIRTICCWTEIS